MGGQAVAVAPAVPGGPPALRPPGTSTVGGALALLGDSWTLLILQRAFLGVRRYGGWRVELGISDSVLAGRLRDLCTAEILRPFPYRDGGRTRHEYRLTARGLDLWSLLVAIWSWERRWGPTTGTGGFPDLHHRGCTGGEVAATDVVLCCATCDDPVTARDTVTTLAPGTSLAGSIAPRRHPRRTRGPLGTGSPARFPGTVEVLGDGWSSCVLGAALLGMRSFTTFRRELGISPDVLSDRLRRFVDQQILVVAPGGYRLTDRGRGTFPMFMMLAAWGDRWLGDTLPPAVRITHRHCGAPLRPVLACTTCGAALDRGDVRFGPLTDPAAAS